MSQPLRMCRPYSEDSRECIGGSVNLRPRLAVGMMTSSTAGVGKKRHHSSRQQDAMLTDHFWRDAKSTLKGKSPREAHVVLWEQLSFLTGGNGCGDVFITKLRCVLGSERTEDHGAPANDILGYCDNNDYPLLPPEVGDRQITQRRLLEIAKLPVERQSMAMEGRRRRVRS